MIWGCWEWPRQVTCALAQNTDQGKPEWPESLPDAPSCMMHKHQGQVWVAEQAESLALRPGTSPMQACPSFPSWLGETRAGPQSREWLLQLLGRNLVHYASPGPTRVGAVSNKAASKILNRLAAGKVSVSFLAPTQPGRKASPLTCSYSAFSHTRPP